MNKHKVNNKLNALLAAKKIAKFELITETNQILLYGIRNNNIIFYLLFKNSGEVFCIDTKNINYIFNKYPNYEVFLQDITKYIE